MSNHNGHQQMSLVVKGRVISGQELKDYAQRNGLCQICGQYQTHKRKRTGMVRTKFEPMTVTNSKGVITVYKGYCIQPTCYPSVRHVKQLLGEELSPPPSLVPSASACPRPSVQPSVPSRSYIHQTPSSRIPTQSATFSLPSAVDAASLAIPSSSDFGLTGSLSDPISIFADPTPTLTREMLPSRSADIESADIESALSVADVDVNPQKPNMTYQEWILKVRADGLELRYVPTEFRSDKNLVLDAVKEDGSSIQYAEISLRDDEDIVEKAVEQKGRALYFASPRMKSNKKIVLKAVKQDGHALKYASDRMRQDKEVVIAAASKSSDAIKYALGIARQDKDCLIAAGMWDEHHDTQRLSEITVSSDPSTKKRVVALSTRFALKEDSNFEATNFTALFKNHEFILAGRFVVYSPNAFEKSTCDPSGEYTDLSWPCRGTYETCKKEHNLKVGHPQDQCCWRYSFRHQLQRAKHSQGFMIQIVEAEDRTGPQELGKGQQIEKEMAYDLAIKNFQVHRPRYNDRHDLNFCEDDINTLVAEIKDWYDGGCKEIMETVIYFPR